MQVQTVINLFAARTRIGTIPRDRGDLFEAELLHKLMPFGARLSAHLTSPRRGFVRSGGRANSVRLSSETASFFETRYNKFGRKSERKILPARLLACARFQTLMVEK